MKKVLIIFKLFLTNLCVNETMCMMGSCLCFLLLGDGEGQNLVGFRAIGTKSSSFQTAAKLLVLTTEHMDNLLSEWYPKIDTYVDVQGVKAIRRVSFCHQCIQQAVEIKNKSLLDTSKKNVIEEAGSEVTYNEDDLKGAPFASAFDMINEICVDEVDITLSEDGEINNHFEDFNAGHDEVDFSPFGLNEEEYDLIIEHRQRGKGKLIAFELEEASKLIRGNKPLLCPFHLKLNPKITFPDLVSFNTF